MGNWGEQCNAMSQIDPQLAKGLGQIQELLSEDNLELLFLINLSNRGESDALSQLDCHVSISWSVRLKITTKNSMHAKLPCYAVLQ